VTEHLFSRIVCLQALDTEHQYGDDPWDDISTLSRSRLWLTHAEAQQFGQELIDLVDRYKKGRTPASHPAGTRQISTLLAVVPMGKPPQES
jgi:hypothetical protein